MFFISWCAYEMTVFVWHRDYLESFDILPKDVDSVHLALLPAILRVKKEPETVFCPMKPLKTKQLRNQVRAYAGLHSVPSNSCPSRASEFGNKIFADLIN